MGFRPVTNTEPPAMSPPTVCSPDSNTAARCRLKDTPTWCGPVWLGASPGGIQLYSDRMPGQRRTSLLTREVLKRAHLDRGGAGQRMRRGYLDGRIQVRALDHVVAAHLLLGLRVRAVGDQQVAVTDPSSQNISMYLMAAPSSRVAHQHDERERPSWIGRVGAPHPGRRPGPDRGRRAQPSGLGL